VSEFKHRTIALYKNYFSDFYKKQRQKVKDKILWTLRIIESQKHIPTDYLKHIEGTDGLYEIRVQQANDIFRIFCFFAKGKIIILINGFQKKTQKTSKSEIERALIIKQNYEQEK
jgi:phage-related protein